jgi:hypothetical protein
MKPYEIVQELLEAAKIHGPYVVGINNHIYYLITLIYPKGSDYDQLFYVILNSHRYNPITSEQLMKLYTWQDGHPCGKNED